MNDIMDIFSFRISLKTIISLNIPNHGVKRLYIEKFESLKMRFKRKKNGRTFCVHR